MFTNSLSDIVNMSTLPHGINRELAHIRCLECRWQHCTVLHNLQWFLQNAVCYQEDILFIRFGSTELLLLFSCLIPLKCLSRNCKHLKSHVWRTTLLEWQIVLHWILTEWSRVWLWNWLTWSCVMYGNFLVV